VPVTFHLSFPVRHVDEAVAFYRELGGRLGRHTADFADVLLFGAQVTLHGAPEAVTEPMPRTRHFGATLPWARWEEEAARLAGRPFVVEAPTITFVGERREQAKLMVSDPSGNLVELKAYRFPDEVLGPPGD
jgi:extradiol dioxygenase family protein